MNKQNISGGKNRDDKVCVVYLYTAGLFLIFLQQMVGPAQLRDCDIIPLSGISGRGQKCCKIFPWPLECMNQ